MTVVFVLALLALALGVAWTARERLPRRPRPPERRIESLPDVGMASAPDGWVTVRASLGPEEALVARGLLEANGIECALVSTTPGLAGYRIPALQMRLYVAPENAEEAAALLGDR